jgi:nitrogen-specific signal transduction histidine kinase
MRVAEQVNRLRSASLEEKTHMLSSLVARATHDANTPLGIALSALDEFSEELANLTTASSEDDREYLDEIATLLARNVKRASELVGNFKAFTAQQVVNDLIDVDLGQCVEETVSTFDLVARKRGLEVSVENALAADGSTWKGYPGRLAQVLMNLLTNAERYAYKNTGGRIEVHVSSPDDYDGFAIRVADFGEGIPAENLERIFEQSFTTGRDRGGTGLGLAIVHSMVTGSFGGKISVESQLGKGTTFSIRIPNAARQMPQLSNDSADESGGNAVLRFARLQQHLAETQPLAEEDIEEFFLLQRATASALSSCYRHSHFREALRIPCALSVTLSADGEEIRGVATNMSETGLRISIPQEPKSQHFTIRCDEGLNASMEGQIVDCRRGDPNWSIGIQFVGTIPSEELRHYLLARIGAFWSGLQTSAVK